MLNGTETRSPVLMNSTPGPTSITSPVISCPRIRPDGAVVRPRTMCWSDAADVGGDDLQDRAVRGLAPDVRRVDAWAVLQLQLRVVDCLHLDLARLYVRNCLVTGHGAVSFGCECLFRWCLLVPRKHAPAFEPADDALRLGRLGGGHRSFGLSDQVRSDKSRSYVPSAAPRERSYLRAWPRPASSHDSHAEASTRLDLSLRRASWSVL